MRNRARTLVYMTERLCEKLRQRLSMATLVLGAKLGLNITDELRAETFELLTAAPSASIFILEAQPHGSRSPHRKFAQNDVLLPSVQDRIGLRTLTAGPHLPTNPFHESYTRSRTYTLL